MEDAQLKAGVGRQSTCALAVAVAAALAATAAVAV